MKKKIEQKILEYFDGQMGQDERKKFEREIELSSELKEKFNSYKKFFSEMREIKGMEISGEYFENILPEFHRFSKKKYSRLPKLAGAFASFIIVALIAWFAASRWLENSTQKVPENNQLTDEEIFQSNDYTSDFSLNEFGNMIQSDSVFTEMLATELNLSEGESLLLAADEYDVTFIDEELSVEEADLIYAQLIDKKFFNGEQ